jgi:hypothetical protein
MLPANPRYQLFGILNEPFACHRGRNSLRVIQHVSLAGAALVPVDDPALAQFPLA